MKKAVSILALILLSVFVLSSCSEKTVDSVAFGTYYNLNIKGKNANASVKKIEALFVEIENQCSVSIETSDIYKLNKAKADTPIVLREHSYYLIKEAFRHYEFTDGAFNPATMPLSILWKFSPGTYSGVALSIPSDEEITPLLPYCSMDAFELNESNRTVSKHFDEAMLDLGGIAKGYAADKAAEILSESDEYVVNIGGNMQLCGDKKIGIAHPRLSEALFGIVKLNNTSVATSGDYERYYIYNEQRYCHIIGKSGKPITTESLISATVFGESAMLCDVFSTAVMVNGREFCDKLTAIGYSTLLINEKTYEIIGDINFEGKDDSYKKK